jgi:hypothetical protein
VHAYSSLHRWKIVQASAKQSQAAPLLSRTPQQKTKASGYHHGPQSLAPLEAEYIRADQLSCFVFRLQLCGGSYIR